MDKDDRKEGPRVDPGLQLKSRPSSTVARVESLFFRVVALALAAMVLAQAYMFYDDLRLFVNYTDRVEVLEALGYPGRDTGERATVTLRLLLVNEPRAEGVRVLVNGREEARFSDGQVSLHVRPGDRLAVDAREHRELLRYRVVQTSAGVLAPPEGWVFETVGTLEELGSIAVEEGETEDASAPLP